MHEAAQRLALETGRLDVMVNNAAWVHNSAGRDHGGVRDRMVEIGYKSVIWEVQVAAEAMDPERGGSIAIGRVNFSPL